MDGGRKMIFELIGAALGGLFGAFIVFNLISYVLNVVTKFKMTMSKNINITLALSIVFVLGWGEFWGLSPDQSIIRYVPFILIMYFYDRRKISTKECPHCQEKIKVNATKCKHCQSELYEKIS
jgi:hypothetical protein